MYCENCGTEISDDAKFCKECGFKVSDINIPTEQSEPEELESKMTQTIDHEYSNDSEEIKDKSQNNENIDDSPIPKTKSNHNNIIIVLAIIVVVLAVAVGLSIMINNESTNNVDSTADDTEESLSPSFTDTIYGIDFKIPEGFETIDGTDNQNKGTSTTYDRSYMGPNAEMITISVSTTQGNFYWDLSQNRAYDDVDKTINGHDGVLSSSGMFSYIDGEKLVIIQGATKSQLKEIIIE